MSGDSVGFELPLKNCRADVLSEKAQIGLTREEALNLGTWLVALADPRGGEFASMYDEVTDGGAGGATDKVNDKGK